MKTINELKAFIDDHIDTCRKIIHACNKSGSIENAEFEKEQLINYKAVKRQLDRIKPLEEENEQLRKELMLLTHETTTGEKGSNSNANV